jgi:hypothetical protein
VYLTDAGSMDYGSVTDERSAATFPQTWFFNCSRVPGHLLAILVPNLLFLFGLSSAGVAQLVEHLICNQRVGGSIPSASSSNLAVGVRRSESRHDNIKGLVSLDTSPFCVFAYTAPTDSTLSKTGHAVGVDDFADGWVRG